MKKVLMFFLCVFTLLGFASAANEYVLDLSAKHYFYVDDNNDQLDVAGDFTVEAFVKCTSNSYTGRLFDRDGVMKIFAVSNSLRFDLDDGNTISTGAVLVDDTWYHIAVSRSGATTRIFLDGEEKASANLAPITTSDSPMYIGGQWNWFGTWNAKIDEFRFSNVARYTSDFTPPSAEFVSDANTILLFHFDDNTQFPPQNSSSLTFTHTNLGVDANDYDTDAELPLPITLLSFTAEALNGVVELNWETASETNNASFVIYRDGVALTSIEGAGTSSETNAYSYIDNTVIPGVTYTYVLADIDYENNENRYNSYAVRVIVVGDEIPKSYELGAAYPNPFNPQSIIPLELKNEARVSVSMYDINGSLVKNILNSQLSSGMHDIQISNENLSSGTYLVRINIDNAVNVRKITYNK